MSKVVAYIQSGRRYKCGGRREGLRGNIRDQGFMAIADDGMDARQRSHLLRGALSITTGHHDACGGIFPP